VHSKRNCLVSAAQDVVHYHVQTQAREDQRTVANGREDILLHSRSVVVVEHYTYTPARSLS